MSGNLPYRLAKILMSLCCVCLLSITSQAAQTTVTRTNLTERWITNVVEVRMPTNIFVNELRTNWVQLRSTNVIDRYATNRIAISAIRTNQVNLYRTNWATLNFTNDINVQVYRTNVIPVYHTNWRSVHLTNVVAVQGFQTNFVDRYQTNLRTLHLTNWQTVLVMKTNWITVPVTNTVTIDLITNRFGASEPGSIPGQTPEQKPTSWGPLAGAVLTEELKLEASGRPSANQVEVQIKAYWTSEPHAPVQIQQWRIERSDGAILTFGQETVFKRALPPGKYKVEVRARRESRGPLLAVRGTLAVSSRDAAMQQNLTAQK